jgi:hypothetical protein
MFQFHCEAGPMRAVCPLGGRVLWRTFALAMAVGVIAAGASRSRAAETSRAPQVLQAAMGEPVNLYAADADVYAPHADGEIHPWHAQGQVWLLAGEPGESNVAVQVGDEGVLVVDAGTQAMAPKLLEQIRRLSHRYAGDQKAIRIVVDTNGRADHIGGNEVLRQAGSQVIAGEEAAQQAAFASAGAEVLAEQNVLTRLSQDPAAGANSSQAPASPM